MTLDQLRYFVAAAKFEHIGRAARSIPISASVISHAVKELEEEFEHKLFVRENKRIRLTEDGLRLKELALELLSQAENLKKELGAEFRPSGHYRIGASSFLALKLVAPVWTMLQSRFSGLTADIHSIPTWEVVDGVLSGDLDFGVGFSPIPHPRLNTQEIYKGNSEVVARKGHPIFKQAKRDFFKLLSKYPATMHIASEKIIAARPHPVLKSAGLESNIVLGFDNDYVALENLKKSDNWAFMIDIVADEFKKDLKTIPIPRKSEAQYTIEFITHRTRRNDSTMNEVLKSLREQVIKMRKAK